MIKFFRHIRQRLLTENKLSKYLIYAIGEIILVVIGILIALQINNWNEARKAYNNELQIYSKLLIDLNDQFKSTINNINSIQNNLDKTFQVYDESRGMAEPKSPTYYNPIQWIFPYQLDITEKYEILLGSVSNEEVRNLLKFYIRQEKVTQEAYNEWNEFKKERLRPFFNKFGIHNTKDALELREYSFYPLAAINMIEHSKLKAQYGTVELDELLFDLRFKTSWVYSNLTQLKKDNDSFTEILIHELELAKKPEFINRIPRKYLSDLLDSGMSIDELVKIIKNDDMTNSEYNISENSINSLGYSFLYRKQYSEALTIFKLNIDLFPNHSNPYDSYGECLLEMGDVENSIKAYKKSLELDPDNDNAKEMLKKISD